MEEQLSRREQKKLETRQRLMETALELFSERGYDATTVKDIASAADVAKGTFFNYFEAKEAILPAIAARGVAQLEEALRPERGAPKSPVARIKLALRLVAESRLCQMQLAERLFAAMIQRREVGPGHALRDLLTKQVCQAQAAGEIRSDLEPAYLSSLIHALFFQRLVMWHHGARPEPFRELLEDSVDLLMEGVAGPNWTRAS